MFSFIQVGFVGKYADFTLKPIGFLKENLNFILETPIGHSFSASDWRFTPEAIRRCVASLLPRLELLQESVAQNVSAAAGRVGGYRIYSFIPASESSCPRSRCASPKSLQYAGVDDRIETFLNCADLRIYILFQQVKSTSIFN